MLKQLSIIAENKVGAMSTITSLIADQGIDFYNVITNDSAEFGNVRIMCSDPAKARDIMKENGYLCKINPVIGVEISEEVGSLSKLLHTFRDINVNISYLYVCYLRSSQNPVAIVHVEDFDGVEEGLEAKGYHTL